MDTPKTLAFPIVLRAKSRPDSVRVIRDLGALLRELDTAEREYGDPCHKGFELVAGDEATEIAGNDLDHLEITLSDVVNEQLP